MRDLKEGLSRIAREIDYNALEGEFLIKEWRKCVYQAHLGMDPRTAYKWLEVANWEKMIISRKSVSGILILCRGALFHDFVNGHPDGEVAESARPTHA